MVKKIKNNQLTDDITLSDAIIGVGFILAVGSFLKFIFNYMDFILMGLIIIGLILIIFGILIRKNG